MDKISYKTPFHVKDGKIFDAENRYVTLWGVNYYAPFNHNFCNLAELGKDHCRAIDRDLDDLQLLGAAWSAQKSVRAASVKTFFMLNPSQFRVSIR